MFLGKCDIQHFYASFMVESQVLKNVIFDKNIGKIQVTIFTPAAHHSKDHYDASYCKEKEPAKI